MAKDTGNTTLNNLTVTINQQFDIPNESITFLSIEHSINDKTVTGRMKIEDIQNLFDNLDIKSNDILTISAEDNLKNVYNQVFVIEYSGRAVEQTLNRSFNYINLEFTDMASFLLSKSFSSKGYNDTELSVIIGDLLDGIKDLVVAPKLNIPKQSTVLLGSDTDLRSLNKLTSKNDVLLLNNRKAFNLTTMKNLINIAGTVYIPVYSTFLNDLAPNSPFTILSYDVIKGDMSKINNIATNMDIYRVDPTVSKSFVKETLGLDSIVVTLGKLSNDKFAFTSASKHNKITFSDIGNSELKNLFTKYLFQVYNVNIHINGAFSNEIGNTVAINIKSLNANTTKKEATVSGLYIITGIKDIFIKDNFFQELTLAREGLNKKDIKK